MTTTAHPKTTKAYKGMAMEGPIARWYAKNARRDTEFKTWANTVNKTVPAGGRVLEVAPGPGFLSIELARLRRRGAADRRGASAAAVLSVTVLPFRRGRSPARLWSRRHRTAEVRHCAAGACRDGRHGDGTHAGTGGRPRP